MICSIPNNKQYKRLLDHLGGKDGLAFLYWNVYKGVIPESFYETTEKQEEEEEAKPTPTQEELTQKVYNKVFSIDSLNELKDLFNKLNPQQQALYKNIFSERRVLIEKDNKIIQRIQSFKTIDDLEKAWNSKKFSEEDKAKYKKFFTLRKEGILLEQRQEEIKRKNVKQGKIVEDFVNRNKDQYIQVQFTSDSPIILAKVTGKMMGLKLEVATSKSNFFIHLSQVVNNTQKGKVYETPQKGKYYQPTQKSLEERERLKQLGIITPSINQPIQKQTSTQNEKIIEKDDIEEKWIIREKELSEDVAILDYPIIDSLQDNNYYNDEISILDNVKNAIDEIDKIVKLKNILQKTITEGKTKEALSLSKELEKITRNDSFIGSLLEEMNKELSNWNLNKDDLRTNADYINSLLSKGKEELTKLKNYLETEKSKNKFYQLDSKSEIVSAQDIVLNSAEVINNLKQLRNIQLSFDDDFSRGVLVGERESQKKYLLKYLKDEKAVDFVVSYAKKNELLGEQLDTIFLHMQANLLINNTQYLQYLSQLSDEADEKLNKKLIDFLKTKLNVDTVFDLTHYPNGIIAAADILNKQLTLYKEGKLDTIAEETGHFFFELFSKENDLYYQLMDNVEKWNGYQKVYNDYKDSYIKDGEPDIKKIKREAIGQAIGQGIIRNFKAQEGNEFFKALQKMLDIIKEFLERFKIFNFEVTIDEIAKDILNNDISKITNQYKSDDFELKSAETLLNYPKVLNIINKFKEINAEVAGSLNYRSQGDLYREKNEEIHDIDITIPYKAYNGNIVSYFEKIKETFPDFTYNLRDGEPVYWKDDYNNNIIYQIFIDDMPIDLFFESENKPVKQEGNKSWIDAFEVKYNYRRPKDMMDILNWKNFEKSKLNDNPSVFYQTGSIKPGVKELFESNPELANIGTQEQYSQYLSTIFPNSKVRDIVYHSRFTVSNIKNKDRWKNGFYSGTKDQADLMADMAESSNDLMTTSALLINMQNPKVTTYTDRKVEDYKNTNDGFIIEATEKDALQLINGRDGYNVDNFKKEYVVFEPEQIHILSSKADIQGFKDFMSFENSEFSKYGTYQQFRYFVINKSSVEIENKLIQTGKIDRVC